MSLRKQSRRMMVKGMLKKMLMLWEERVGGGRRARVEDAVAGLAHAETTCKPRSKTPVRLWPH